MDEKEQRHEVIIYRVLLDAQLLVVMMFSSEHTEDILLFLER